MTASRVLSQGRCLVSRGLTAHRATGPILRAIVTSSPARQLSSSARVRNEVTQKPVVNSEILDDLAHPITTEKNARSIAILNVPWKAAPADVKALLSNAGVNM